MGDWKIILPEVGTNLVLNPVAMGTGNFGVAGVGPTVSTVTTYSYLGYKCFRMQTATQYTGIYFVTAALANAIHYVTLRMNINSIDINMLVSLDGITWNQPTLLGQEGDWYVYGVQIPAAQANGSTYTYLESWSAFAVDWYIGHVQVEQNTYPTTPITGDIKGFCSDGYYWNGAAHASSSTRAAKERKGGKVVDLETTYNFKVLYGVGSGMPPITHHTQSMALLPGALYSGHKVEPRVLDLHSATKGNTAPTVSAARRDFINAVKPDQVSPEQPVVIRYSGVNSLKPVEFYAYYDSGLEFQLTSGVTDKPDARFICYDPFCYETHTQGAALTTSLSVADADECIRKIGGTWYNFSTDFNGAVFTFTKGNNGNIYLGGSFNNGVAANYIIKWNPFTSSISQLTGGSGSGTNGSVYALATAPNGDIYLGGAFILAGAIANTAYIAKWNGTEFSPLSTGLTSNCRSIVIGLDGSVYIGGDFTNVGDANGDYITKWNGTAFSSLGTGANGIVRSLAIAPNGDLIATGEFTLMGGIANTAYIARWNGTAWTPLGTGLAGGTPAGYALAVDKAGNIYVGGNFTTADGVSCSNIAKWNGKTFEPLGSGTNNSVRVLYLNNNGLLYAGGLFTSAGGISLNNRFAVWNGTTWANIDAKLPGGNAVYAINGSNNDLYFGYDNTGAATTSYLNTITNNGSTSAYPVIKINRSGGTSATLEWLKNETTGDTLWCNYALLDGETITIDLTPGNRSIKSDFYGDVWRAVLRSSDFSSFSLLPGENKISAFVNNTGATITAWLEWPLTHWSSDTVAA